MIESIDSESEVPGSGLLLFTCVLQVVCWSVFVSVLMFYVPRARDQFEDFGVELPSATISVIALSDLAVHYWYYLVPVMVFAAVGLTAFVFAASRSLTARLCWTVIAALIPMLLAGGCWAGISLALKDGPIDLS